jgi:hypothetical protein
MLAAALFAAALALANPHASAQTTTTGTVKVKWQTQALVRVTLTPNYAAGFGQIPAVIGTQPAPTHGPDASLDGGSVDFGNVLAGKNYIYKYATHLNVTSNSATGLNVYGEGAADFFNTSDSSTVPLSQSVYWLNSAASGDANTGFSPGTPFQKTSGAVTGGGQFSPPTISYVTYPAPISTSPLANADFYYDYQLKVPAAATAGLYYVWIVYTVVSP